MRGAPSQWDVGSLWIGDGGVYPGMGETVGLAGTSPERADGGLWNDGGAVGDPPYDPYQMESFDSSIGAGSMGGPGGYVSPAPNGSSGSAGGSGDGFGAHIVAGGFSFAVIAGLVFYWHHKVTDHQDGHSPVRWTIGEIGLVSLASAAGVPIVKTIATWIGSRFPIAAPLADYVNAA